MNPPGNQGQNGRGQQRMQQMIAQLGLTPDQQQQIQQIRATITDRQERREAIMKVLTPDQQVKYQQMRGQGRNRGGGGGGGGGGNGGGAPPAGGEAGAGAAPASAPPAGGQ